MRNVKAYNYLIIILFTLIFTTGVLFTTFAAEPAYADAVLVNYETLKSEYSEFGLPESQTNLNITKLTASNFTKESLETAIASATTTVGDDLIYIKAATTAYQLDYGNSCLAIDYDASVYGKLFIIADGTTIPVIKTSLPYAINVINGDVCFGNIILERTQTLTTVNATTKSISAGQNATVKQKKIIDKNNNLNNGYYSLEFCLDETTNEYVFLAGLKSSDIQTTVSSIKTFTSVKSVTNFDFIDAEKINNVSTSGDYDSLMCWAAALSNVLYYTGWTNADNIDIDFETIFDYYDEGLASNVDYSREDAIFKYFKNNFTNAGSNFDYASDWFFTGNYDAPSGSDWAQLEIENSGGLFEKFIYDYIYDSMDISYLKQDIQIASPECFNGIADTLRLSGGIGLAVGFYVNPNKYTDYAAAGLKLNQSYGGHALTAWGYTYDADLETDSADRITSVIISDSDDNKTTSGYSLPDSKPNKLYRMDLQWGLLNNYKYCYYSTDYSSRYYTMIMSYSSVASSNLFVSDSIGTVVNTTDSVDYFDGKTSLFEAITYAAINGLDTITFDASLNGATIEIDRSIPLTNMDLVIDATSLPDKINIHYTSSVRPTADTLFEYAYEALFDVSETSSLTVKNVNITATPAVMTEFYSTTQLLTCIDNYGTLAIENSSISGFSGFYGGAVYNAENGTATISNSTIRDNYANHGGGGIYNAGTMTLINTSVINNSAPYSSPIYNNKYYVNPYGGIYNLGTLKVGGSIIIDDNFYTDNSNTNTHIDSDLYLSNGSSLIVVDDLTADSIIGIYAPNAQISATIATLENADYTVDMHTFIINNSDLVGLKTNNLIRVSKLLAVTYYINNSQYCVFKVYYNDDLPVPDLPNGYTFDGWYTVSAFTNTTEKYTGGKVTENIMLYGKLYYNLTYFVNGVETNTELVYYGALPSYKPSLSESKKFYGWYVNENFSNNDEPYVFTKTQAVDKVYGKTETIEYTVCYYLDTILIHQENVILGNTPTFEYQPPANKLLYGWYTNFTMLPEEKYNNEPIRENTSLYGKLTSEILTVSYTIDNVTDTTSVDYGGTTSVSLVAPDGYSIEHVYVNGKISDELFKNGRINLSNVTSDIAITTTLRPSNADADNNGFDLKLILIVSGIVLATGGSIALYFILRKRQNIH